MQATVVQILLYTFDGHEGLAGDAARVTWRPTLQGYLVERSHWVLACLDKLPLQELSKASGL